MLTLDVSFLRSGAHSTDLCSICRDLTEDCVCVCLCDPELLHRMPSSLPLHAHICLSSFSSADQIICSIFYLHLMKFQHGQPLKWTSLNAVEFLHASVKCSDFYEHRHTLTSLSCLCASRKAPSWDSWVRTSCS